MQCVDIFLCVEERCICHQMIHYSLQYEKYNFASKFLYLSHFSFTVGSNLAPNIRSCMVYSCITAIPNSYNFFLVLIQITHQQCRAYLRSCSKCHHSFDRVFPGTRNKLPIQPHFNTHHHFGPPRFNVPVPYVHRGSQTQSNPATEITRLTLYFWKTTSTCYYNYISSIITYCFEVLRNETETIFHERIFTTLLGDIRMHAYITQNLNIVIK